MTLKRLGGVATAAVLLAVAVLLGGALRGESRTDDPGLGAQAPAVAADAALSGFSTGDTEALVVELQGLVRENPDDVRALSLLGLAYQQRGRETGDPSYYGKAEGVLEQALSIDPSDLLATTGLGSLALVRHEFDRALELGNRARELSPSTARAYGVIGDALLELGRYEEAFAAFDRMVELKPSVSSYARISYARELLGELDGAIESMELAVDAARGSGEPSAWSMAQLGKLHFSAGAVDEAAFWLERALAVSPGYVNALEGLAHVQAARGDVEGAIETTRKAADISPLPGLVVLLGDLYAVSGRDDLAGEQYALMDAIFDLQRDAGIRSDLEQAVYYADHGIRLDEAVSLARTARAARPSIEGDDALAWALARSGRCEEAKPFSDRALRLGTLDAAKLFHRGMIARCLGDRAEAANLLAQALDLNPSFSVLLAPEARAALAEVTA